MAVMTASFKLATNVTTAYQCLEHPWVRDVHVGYYHVDPILSRSNEQLLEQFAIATTAFLASARQGAVNLI